MGPRGYFAPIGPRGGGGVGDLTGGETRRKLASACLRSQGSLLRGHAGLGGAHTNIEMEGAAPAASNAMFLVLCTDYSGLEPILGPLGMLPTMEEDPGFCVGLILSHWAAWLSQKGHS